MTTPRRTTGETRRRTIVASLVLVASLITTTGRAQTPAQLATRRALLDEAQRASNEGRHVAALAAARHAAEIHATPSLRLFVAQEEVALSHLSAALGEADRCVAEATRDATLSHRDDIIAECRALEDDVRARAGTIVVVVPTPPPEGLRVTVAGETLDALQFSAPVIVAPGSVAIEASAAGRRAFAQSVDVAPQSRTTVHVVLEPAGVASASAEPPPRSAPPASSPASARAATPPPRSPIFTPMRVAGGVVALVGAGALVAGLVVHARTDAAWNQCLPHLCAASAEPRADDVASVAAIWSGAAVVVVGAGLAIAGPWIFTGERERGVSAVWLDPRGAAGVAGRF